MSSAHVTVKWFSLGFNSSLCNRKITAKTTPGPPFSRFHPHCNQYSHPCMTLSTQKKETIHTIQSTMIRDGCGLLFIIIVVEDGYYHTRNRYNNGITILFPKNPLGITLPLCSLCCLNDILNTCFVFPFFCPSSIWNTSLTVPVHRRSSATN